MFPQRVICWPTAMLAVANRMFDKLHEDEPWHDGTFTIWADEFSNVTPWHFRDGTNIFNAPTDGDPADEFTTDKYAKPASLRRRERSPELEDPDGGHA